MENKLKGSISLSYPTLTKGNYTAWSMKMSVYIQAHGVWEAVEKSDPKAVIETKIDKIALAMIYQGIPEEYLLSIAEKKIAKDAWEAIKTMSQGADKVKQAKVQILKAEFEALTMKEADQIDDFYMKINGIVSNIRALGEPVAKSYMVKKLLRVVPPKFLQIASTLEQFGDLETMFIEEAVGALKAHEERMRGTGTTSDAQLMLTEEKWRKKDSEGKKLLLTWLKRSNRGPSGGSLGQRGRGSRDKSQVRCFNCGIMGHYAAECRKPRRGREMKPEVNIAAIEDDGPALLLAKLEQREEDLVLLNEGEAITKLMSKGYRKAGESNIWYLGNGASNHMMGDETKFSTLNKNVGGNVRFRDGSSIGIEGKGSIKLRCKNGEKRTLEDVYYLPTLQNNIISLGQLSKRGNEIVISGDLLRVYDNQRKLLMKVTRSKNRLYKIALEPWDGVCMLTKSKETSWLWHSHLGHVNFHSMELMSKKGMVKGMPAIVIPKKICSGCLMAKQVRKSFPAQSSFKTSHALELVHGDL
ncbi:uncharacterized protein LOC141695529 [Apium graveolens]|uniref:uncharacterized protein LOC141695529 n=1 Tax=Apium graveolens TaxID=4045 RepID=UPI003D7B2822